MKKGLDYIGPSILGDNEMNLFMFVLMVLNYSDCCYDITISKGEEKTICHVTPSNPEFKKDIIDNLLYINKMMKKKVIVFSKSLAISKIVSFEILM